jgi:hypothetical protein
MVEWYLWDGESQHGPMDRRELDSRIQYHPNQAVILVWRDGFSGWKSIEEAFNLERESSLDPSTFARPHEGPKKSTYQNFVARNWRGEYPLWISYWIIGVLSNVSVLAIATGVGALMAGSYQPIGILLFFLLLWSFITFLSIWQLVGIWRSANRRIAERATVGRRA